MLGLPRDEVFLVAWTENWSKEFLLERAKIQEKIGEYLVGVYHVGSTAVEDLNAKPIIDIAIEINEFNDGEHCISLMESLNYTYRGTNILPDRHYFSKGEPRTHQIHMYQRGNKFLIDQLKFRDYLRNNDGARMEYQNLKMCLSKANKDDRHKYTAGKSDFIKEILEKV